MLGPIPFSMVLCLSKRTERIIMDILFIAALSLGGLLALVLAVLAFSFIILMINPEESLDYTFDDDEI